MRAQESAFHHVSGSGSKPTVSPAEEMTVFEKAKWGFIIKQEKKLKNVIEIKQFS